MRWVNDAREDFWFGCRRLTRDLDATTAVVLVLACGIGLSVAMFAVADTVLRRPLPILDQERVVVLWGEAGGSMRTLPLTPEHFERFRSETRTLQEVAGTVSIDSWAQSVRDGEQTFRASTFRRSREFLRRAGGEGGSGPRVGAGRRSSGRCPRRGSQLLPLARPIRP